MEMILRPKHWQLFLLTFCLPFLLEIIIMANIFSDLMDNHNPRAMAAYLKFFPLIITLFVIVLFCWQWAVAIGLQKMVPRSINMKVAKFKILFFIPVVYLIFIFSGMILFFNTSFIGDDAAGFSSLGVFLIIIPIHLFAMFCIFYSMYFAAKTLKTVELKRPVTFSDFAGEFFLVWFFPIGVWILQPRINKLVMRHNERIRISEQM